MGRLRRSKEDGLIKALCVWLFFRSKGGEGSEKPEYAKTARVGKREERRLTRVNLFSYRAVMVPDKASIASIALEEALETVMFRFGVVKCSAPW